MKAYGTLIILFLLTGYAAQGQVSYVQPERVIKCSTEDNVCEITLTVDKMTTLTAYEVVSGSRTKLATPVTVNSEGKYEFVYGLASGQENLTRLQPIAGDGVTRRVLYVINDQFPAPTIMGYTNQTVRIRVINKLRKEAVSLHWHGMHMLGTPYMDGVTYVTQCPVLPNNDFVYEFQLFPEGTFWYHAHLAAQRSNGLYGALIVLPRDPPPTDYVDMLQAHTLLLNEWFTIDSEDWQDSAIFISDPVNSSVPFQPVPIHDGSNGIIKPFLGGLINGAGWLYTQDSPSCRRLANTTLPFFNVTQGTKYRFRVIGSQANQALRISIKDHRLQLIASDGFNTKVPDSMPQEVDFIIVHVAERYDFIVNANQPIDNYAIIAETLEVPSELANRGYCEKAHRAYSVLHYEGAPESISDDFDSYNPYSRCSSNQCYAINCPFKSYPSELNTTCINLNQLELTNPEPIPTDDVSETVFLHFSVGAYINFRLLTFPPSPILSQTDDISRSSFCEYSQNESLSQSPDKCINTYTALSNTVEMVFIAHSSDVAHPVHIHGHHFRVLHVGYPIYNPDGTVLQHGHDITCGGPPDRHCDVGVSWNNGTPPPSECEAAGTCPIKDTVVVPSGGYVRVRFSNNNWGWWLLHCHIQVHFIQGMGIVINATAAPGHVPPPNNYPQCGLYQSSQATTSPMVNECRLDATIGLAVVAGVLLLALVLVSFISLCFFCKVKMTTQGHYETETGKIALVSSEEL